MFRVKYPRIDQEQISGSKNKEWIAGRKLYDSVRQNKLAQVKQHLKVAKNDIFDDEQKKSLLNYITENNLKIVPPIIKSLKQKYPQESPEQYTKKEQEHLLSLNAIVALIVVMKMHNR